MKKDFADVSFVLDRSGSMQSVRDDTIGGFNSFIEAQQKQPGECVASLLQFDDKFDVLYEAKPIKDVPKLNNETFVPRGGTALLDAIGRTINETGKRLSLTPEDSRPEKVIFVILTDGGQNCSKEFTHARIKEMINHQTDVYKWDFVFIGANQDAIQTGDSIGIASGKSMTYASNAMGTANAFRSMSKYVSTARASYNVADVNFDQEDRDAQSKAGA